MNRRQRWQCPNCMDTMDRKFQRSHTWLCWWISLALENDIERLINQS